MRVVVALAIIALCRGEIQLGHRKDELELEAFEPRIFEDAINKSVECIRNVLKNGDESTGRPSYDPFIIDALAIDLDQYDMDHFKGQLSLNNFIAEGQLGWHISELKITPTIFPIGVKVTLTLGWEATSFSGGYDINANILDHSIKGVGNISGSATNFALAIQIQGALSRVSVKQLEIMPYLDSIDFKLGQLAIGDNEVSEHINNNVGMLLNFIKDNLEIIGGRLSEAILNIINKQYSNESANYSIIGDVMKCIQL